MNCTSNSAMTAMHLGCQAIEHGGVDIVLVVNCSKIKTQDIWFLDTQSMLDTHLVQPFGENSKGVLLRKDTARFCSKMRVTAAQGRQAPACGCKPPTRRLAPEEAMTAHGSAPIS